MQDNGQKLDQLNWIAAERETRSVRAIGNT
jgi:hypothetical protein